MKNILKYILLALITYSCQKEEDLPKPITQEVIEPIYKTSLFNKWKIKNAWLYMKNIDTNEKVKYNHFSSTRTTSSLRWGYPWFNIEIIVKDITTWEFTNKQLGNGIYEFILNDTDTFAYKLSNSFTSIIEHPYATSADEMHLGGSARPIEIWTDDGNNIKIAVQNMYDVINENNYNYYSVIEFEPLN